MSRVEVSAEIDAAPQAVWDFVSELRRIPEWIEDTLAMLSVEPEPAGLGTVYRERSRILGPWRQVTTWEIVEFDPPRWQKHYGRVPMMSSASVGFRLEPAADGTHFTLTFEYTPGNPVSALTDALFVRRNLQAGFERSLRKLKALVEAGVTASP